MIFSQFTAGSYLSMPNRIVMLALTRARAESDGTPTALMAEYYAQRATAGLIISEACSVSDVGRPFLTSPGMYTHEHALGWRAIVDAVHTAGSRIVLQINHCGRVNNLSHLRRPVRPVAPSAVGIPRDYRNITINIPRVTPYEVPRALETEEIALVVEDFRHATRLAAWAGFDGVQVHADSGYLIHQFLSTNVNLRTDRYGGTPENRARFALEVVGAVTEVCGPEFVSVKFTPRHTVHDIVEDDASEKYDYLAHELNARGPLAFLHISSRQALSDPVVDILRRTYKGTVLVEGSLTIDQYRDLIARSGTDLIGFGRPFIANPDLVHRLRNTHPLAEFEPGTVYTPGPAGYTDYPSCDC